MGIDGRMRMAFVSGYDENDKNYETKNLLELKDIVDKLYAASPKKGYKFEYGIKDVSSLGCEINKTLIIEVPDNRNFWFQLTQLPKMLIPNFWNMTEDEIETHRQNLIANDAWVLDNLKKLADKTHCVIYVIESYDSSAQGEYNYVVYPTAAGPNQVCVLNNNKLPNHAEALRRAIAIVKQFAKTLRQEGKNVKLCTKEYWGMFK